MTDQELFHKILSTPNLILEEKKMIELIQLFYSDKIEFSQFYIEWDDIYVESDDEFIYEEFWSELKDEVDYTSFDNPPNPEDIKDGIKSQGALKKFIKVEINKL